MSDHLEIIGESGDACELLLQVLGQLIVLVEGELGILPEPLEGCLSVLKELLHQPDNHGEEGREVTALDLMRL